MQTKLDLCTMALLKLGEQPIQSLNQDTPAAQLARTLFDSTMDTLLASHPWRFATRRIKLKKNTDGNFLIPSECLRVLRCDGEIFGNHIAASGDTMTITATVRVSPEKFPGYFASVAATKLAMEFCIPLMGDKNVFSMLAALYETELQSAKFIDSAASNAHSSINKFSLINARF